MLGLTISTADISGTFLYADLEEDIYIKLPDGRIAKLNKSIYGLRQAARNWFKLLSDTAWKKTNLKESKHDECIVFDRMENALKSLMLYTLTTSLPEPGMTSQRNKSSTLLKRISNSLKRPAKVYTWASTAPTRKKGTRWT